MKRRTYNNFLKAMKYLQGVKHYDRSEAEQLARQVFDNCEADRGRGDRPVEWFLDKILTKEEYLAEEIR